MTLFDAAPRAFFNYTKEENALKHLRRTFILLLFIAFCMIVSFLLLSCKDNDGFMPERSYALSIHSKNQSSQKSDSTESFSSDTDSVSVSASWQEEWVSTPFQSFDEFINTCEHSWAIEEVLIQPNCTEGGLFSYRCSDCGEKKMEEVPELGHTLQREEAVAPTCNKIGHTEMIFCTVCKEVFAEREDIPKVYHVFIGGVICQWCGLSTLAFELNDDDPLDPYYVCTGYSWYEHKQRVFVVPDTYEGLPVRAIAEKAFYKEYFLNGITLGKNIKTIGDRAFGFCYNLMEVCNYSDILIKANSSENRFLNGEIGIYAKAVYTTNNYESKLHTDENGFVTYQADSDTKIAVGYDGNEKKIVLTEGITHINSCAFGAAIEVQSITLADSVRFLDVYAFSQCYSLTELCFGRGTFEISPQQFLRFTDRLDEYFEPFPMVVIGKTTGKLMRMEGDKVVAEQSFAPGQDMYNYFATELNTQYYYIYKAVSS